MLPAPAISKVNAAALLEQRQGTFVPKQVREERQRLACSHSASTLAEEVDEGRNSHLYKCWVGGSCQIIASDRKSFTGTT
jgi:hypothetical protein